MSNFGQIVYNVGVRIGDTSTSFAAAIRVYANQRYKDIFERFNWGTINNSFAFNSGTGAVLTEDGFGLLTETGDSLTMDVSSDSYAISYLLPTDFDKPVYCYDKTNYLDLPEMTFQDIERIYPNQLYDSGTSLRYAIYEKINSTSGVIEKWIKLHPIPAGQVSILLPYYVSPTDMSATTDTPIIDCSYEVELGATADAWRTKRQFAKAADFDRQFEQGILSKIWRQENQPNKIVQFMPKTFSRDQLY
jgi:hypothetical protein